MHRPIPPPIMSCVSRPSASWPTCCCAWERCTTPTSVQPPYYNCPRARSLGGTPPFTLHTRTLTTVLMWLLLGTCHGPMETLQVFRFCPSVLARFHVAPQHVDGRVCAVPAWYLLTNTTLLLSCVFACACACRYLCHMYAAQAAGLLGLVDEGLQHTMPAVLHNLTTCDRGRAGSSVPGDLPGADGGGLDTPTESAAGDDAASTTSGKTTSRKEARAARAQATASPGGGGGGSNGGPRPPSGRAAGGGIAGAGLSREEARAVSHTNACMLHLLAGRMAQAQEECRTALATFPGLLEARRLKVYLDIRTGRQRSGAEFLKEGRLTPPPGQAGHFPPPHGGPG